MTQAAPLTYTRWIALALARALQVDDHLPGGREAGALLGRASACLGVAHIPWLRPLCEVLARVPTPRWVAQTPRSLADHLESLHEFYEGFDSALYPRVEVRRLLLRPARMTSRPFALEDLALPAWGTLSDLAAGLGIDVDLLEVLAGPQQRYREATATPRRPHVAATSHYRALLVPKRRGGLRLIEAPMPALKVVQRRLLDELLRHVPVHECAHGFVPGRNVASHATLHAGRDWVFRFDLRDFFPSIGHARIVALFRTLGYPDGVAARLTTLCTARTSVAVRERLREAGALDFNGAKRLASPHLPQGAPTSPHLANLCAFGLDLRMEGLAHRFGARYSRYADDLVFSGPKGSGFDARAFRAFVTMIVEDEGFRLRADKTLLMRAGRRQTVTGVVVNTRPNLARPDYDRLRAELHHLARSGPVSAAQRDEVRGRIAWATQFVAPSHVAKLRRLFDAILPSDQALE